MPLILFSQSNKEVIREDNLIIINRTGIESGVNNPIGFGLEELYHAINTKNGTIETVKHWTQTDQNTFLIVGTTDNRMVARLLDQPEANLSRPEGVMYDWVDTREGTALVVAGTDERGLMYALLELADRIKAHGLQALNAVEDLVEFPDNRVRGVDRFLQNPNTHSWVLSKEFWEYYVKRLAYNRFNRLVVIAGYNTGFGSEYMRPPYPFLVEVPGFPDVHLSDKFKGNRKEQLENLRTIGRLCHAYGLDFVFGSWFHGKENRAGEETESVIGLPGSAKQYSEYTKKGMRELLMTIPEIDGVQLRINWESGLGGESGQTAELFWKGIIESVSEVSRTKSKDIFLDLRAKGLTERMREWALEEGLNLSVPTKYTWEATGLPYHTSRMRIGELNNLNNLDRRQRYSYADFLYEPRPFDVFYRLWSISTNRLLVWGDPDYARRFSQNASFGGGTGFEITPPLSMKKGTWELFEDRSLIDYKWEDERYWAWYLLFGRLGYNTDADPAIWQREFRQHFREAGESMLHAYQTAGKLLPLLTSAHLTKHPAFSHWAEKDAGGALFASNNINKSLGKTTYLTVEPGDPGLFYGIDNYVEDYLGDSLKAKYTPMQLSQWYINIARETRKALTATEGNAILSGNSGEFQANLLDLAITADLAAFHSYKTLAALNLCFYQKTGNAAYLPASLENMKAAQKEWQSLSDRTADTYNDEPSFVRDPSGKNWQEMLKEINTDMAKLEELVQQENPSQKAAALGKVIHPVQNSNSFLSNLSFTLTLQIKDNVPETWIAGKDLPVKIKMNSLGKLNLDQLTLHYRRANLAEGEFKRVEMEKTPEGFKGKIPGDYITADYDLLVYLGGIEENGNAMIYPGLYHPEYPAPYHVVEINKK